MKQSWKRWRANTNPHRKRGSESDAKRHTNSLTGAFPVAFVICLRVRAGAIPQRDWSNTMSLISMDYENRAKQIDTPMAKARLD